MLIVVFEPGAENTHDFTWFSMHFETTGSSPVDEVLATVPFGATFAVTVTLTLDFVSAPPRSQHVRLTPARWFATTRSTPA
jgi:hypothetical protein